MEEIKDGGPAFPVNSPEHFNVTHKGMSLRDNIAINALSLIEPFHPRECYEDGGNGDFKYKRQFKDKSEMAYEMADAMLAARQPKGE